MATEKRLIDEFKCELMSKFIDLCRGNDYNKLTLLRIGETIDSVYEKYRLLPTVDAVEVVHGNWVYYSTTMQECSNCKRHTARHKFKYCPYCGATMGDKLHYAID